MKFIKKDPARKFLVGNSKQFYISDCGEMHLDYDEQISFKTETGAEYDVARKSWGFYATPSLNARLPYFGLNAVLAVNTSTSRYYILLVEEGKDDEFLEYCRQESLKVVTWLSSDKSLYALGEMMSKCNPS